MLDDFYSHFPLEIIRSHIDNTAHLAAVAVMHADGKIKYENY